MYTDDDHLMCVCGETMEERTLTNEGREISNCYQLDLLKRNPDKFQSISLGRRHTNKVMKVKVLDKLHSKWSRNEAIGVTFDKHLKSTCHLDELPKRVSRKIVVCYTAVFRVVTQRS